MSNYHTDKRTQSLHPPGWTMDESKLKLIDDEGGEYPATRIVCPTCNGSGSCVNPSIDSGGISGEQMDDDPEFRADYFGGRYDIACPHCKGQNVVLSCKAPEYLDACRDEASYQAEIEAERRMGC